MKSRQLRQFAQQFLQRVSYYASVSACAQCSMVQPRSRTTVVEPRSNHGLFAGCAMAELWRDGWFYRETPILVKLDGSPKVDENLSRSDKINN